jgi:hypothetical protein
MSTLKSDIAAFMSNHSNDELLIALGELARKLFPNDTSSKGVRLLDADQRAVGLFVPEKAVAQLDMSDYPTFLAVTRYRIANPPERFLTEEEFLSQLGDGASSKFR